MENETPAGQRTRRIRELVEAALSGGDGVERVYRDEPILFAASQMKDYTPPKYREMKSLVSVTRFSSESEIFLRQAEFMADFDDTFAPDDDFFCYFPTYRSMTTAQLRGYFSWRGEVRRKNIRRTSLSYAFVYIYELLNRVGTASAEDGFFRLRDFVAVYGEWEPKLALYAGTWLRDYAVYYSLDPALINSLSLPDAESDRALLTLAGRDAHSTDELFDALCELSAYKIKSSPFYKKHSADTAAVCVGAYLALAEYYKKKNAEIHEVFFGRSYTSYYTMFSSAVFCRREKHADCVYEINPLCRYICRGGAWQQEKFLYKKASGGRAAQLLKSVDFHMRRRYGFKSSLKDPVTSGIITDAVERTLDAYLNEKKAAELEARRRAVNIDTTRLDAIRESALVTQNRLIIDEDEPEPVEAASEAPEMPEARFALDGALREFAALLLSGKAYDAFLRQHGMMASVAADAVNEALFETFGDTVIYFDGECPKITEDYIDELKGMLEL